MEINLRRLLAAVACCISSSLIPISVFAQTEMDTSAVISINNKQLTIIEAARTICRNVGCHVEMSTEVTGYETVINVDFFQLTYKEALREVLEKNGFTFVINGNCVKIMDRIPGTSLSGMKLTGNVVDEHDKKPVKRASVRIKRTLTGTVTDIKGEFMLPDVRTGDVLWVFAPEYDSSTVPVQGDRMLLQLTKKSRRLAPFDVPPVFVHTPQRGDHTNVSPIPAADIVNQPVGNPLLTLQGRVPGLFITQQNGIPGAALKVQLQGRNSISGLNEPMYVIDGVPLLSGWTFPISGIQGGAGNPLELINPDDIERIIVLKDADAAAIYGSRGVNGVILIYTKKGAYDSSGISLRVTNGLGTVTRRLDVFNTPEYLSMRSLAYSNDGLSIPDGRSTADQTNADFLIYPRSRNVSWQKVLAGRPSQYMYASLSWAHGGPRTNYRIGAGLHRETTVFPGDLFNREATFLVNVNHQSRRNSWQQSFTVFGLTGDNQLIDKDLIQTAVSLAPNAPDLFLKSGALNWAPLPNGDASWTNPLALLDQQYRNKIANFIAASTFSYRISKRFYLAGNFNYNLLLNKQTLVIPVSSFAPQFRAILQDQWMGASDRLHGWLAEPALNYSCRLPGGSLVARVRQVWQHNDGYYARNSISGDTKRTANDVSAYNYSATGILLKYDLLQRYRADLSVYRESSSRFTKDHRGNYALSMELGWMFSNEEWFRQRLPVIDSGLLNVSYSMLGSDDIFRPYGPGQALSDGRVNGWPPDSALKWGGVNKFAITLQTGIKRSQLFFTASYYRNDAVCQLPDGENGNFTVGIRNSGWEFLLKRKHINNPRFMWSTEANFTLPENKLLSFAGLEHSSYAGDFFVGQSIDIVRLYQSAGMDMATGYPQVMGHNGNVLPVDSMGQLQDRQASENLGPRYYGGLLNNFTIGRFDISILFQFVKQMGPEYRSTPPGLFNGASNMGNQQAGILERVPAASYSTILSEQRLTSFSNSTFSTDAITDASFIRLKSLSISWRPNIGARKDQLRVFAQGQNLLTFTRYSGMDPESRSSVTLPPLKVFTVGLSLTI
ncbi:TonB-dependent receptor plug domain-containing protein [Chitinophaga agrisoli]|uniref:TonB-dependent receptor plug domain-containing protein n=1 Tax=Chitinophaga agrisoli TaxID=2607653 RepID=A0A5B2VLK9_9BACT|nr:TonB-dependent receptor plug domain-containing protein [Chitinophaga agrisoli]KAA2239744.1 TonB-dependent receptor plug domain-containing protein [Chitinophaga agrisoli]